MRLLLVAFTEFNIRLIVHISIHMHTYICIYVTKSIKFICCFEHFTISVKLRNVQ